MLSLSQIKDAVAEVAINYPIKSVQLFGSYANGQQNENSDVDVLVEFTHNPISLLKFFGFQQDLSDMLGIPVDIVKFPLSKEAEQTLIIDRTVTLYGK